MTHENSSEGSDGTPTRAPRVGPTVVPSFDVEGFARDSGSFKLPSLLSEIVFEIVPDVSWADAQLDLVERQVIAVIDGVSPVALLESVIRVPRDELHAVVLTLLARGIVAFAADTECVPTSGTYRRVTLDALDSEAAARRVG